jgi:hypothetical protein
MLPHGPTTALNSSADPAAGALNQQGVNLDDPDPIRAAWAKRRELAASQPSAPPRPEPEYQPYSSGGHRQSPEDLQRMWRSARLFGGAAEADNRLQMGLAMNAQVDKADAAGEASNYKRWIADQKARLGNQPLSEAGQEMLIAARMASPEGALTGTRADQDALRSIGAAGVRDKAIDAGTKKTVVTERSKDARQTRDQDFRGQNAALDDETKRRGQDINAENVRVQQAGRQADPAAEREAKLVGISRAGDVGRREAEDILDSGDYSHLSPSAQARVERALGTVDAQGGDKKGIARYAAAIGGGDARTQESVERKVLDPGTHTERLKLRDEIAQTRQSVHEAKSGFETLAKNPMALRAFTNIGVAGASKIGSITSIDGAMDFVRNAAKSGTQFAMSEEEQIAAAKIVRMLAKTAFSQGGKNLTQHELGLFGAGSGVDLGAGVGILKTPQMLQQYLQSIAKAYVTRKKNIGKEYKGLEGDL